MSKERQAMEDWVYEQIQELDGRGKGHMQTVDITYVQWMCRRCYEMGRSSALSAAGVVTEENDG